MNFKQGLNEYSDDIPLLKWNLIQKNIWLDLCDEYNIDKNNVDIFTKFSVFFDMYYKSNRRFPDTEDVITAILESNDIHIKAYKKTLKSKGKKPYLTWINKIKGKI